MNALNISLVALIYLLYGYQCLFWISPDEEGYSRLKHGWKPHIPSRSKASIRGGLVIVSDPLLLRPGFLRVSATRLSPELAEYALRRVAAGIRKLWFTRQLCRFQAFLLLVVLPFLILGDLFTWLGPEFCLILLLTHGVVMIALTQELPRTRRVRWISVAAPLLFNPFRAIRLLDTIADLRYREVLRYADERGSRPVH